MGSLIERKKRILMATDPELPPWYQRKTNLIVHSNDGVNVGPYIVTNYVPTIGDAIYERFMVLTQKSYHTLFSASTGNMQLICIIGQSNNSDRWCRYFSSTSKSFTATISNNTWYEFTVNANGTFSCNGGSTTIPPEGALGSTDKLYLFKRANNTHQFVGKVSSFRITNGTQLKMNMIPCIRLSDNEAGMYDSVSNTFYTSVNAYKFAAE